MIIMEVNYIMKPGKRGVFLEAVAPYAQASREEDGNYKYDYYLDPTDENNLLLLEKWENDDILAAHFASDHMKKISELKELYIEETIFTKHYVQDK